MPGVPRELAEHILNIDPKFKPVRQFLHHFNEERRKAIGEEVARLLVAGFIVEVFHPEWLANPVLVLRKMAPDVCVWITQTSTRLVQQILLPSPRIDQIIDAKAGCERLTFFGCVFWLSSDQNGS